MQNKTRSDRAVQTCREYRDSGLTQKEFCEERGIARSTLSLWLKKEREQSESQALVKVEPKADTLKTGSLRIKVGERVVIEVDRPVDTVELKQVLAAVAEL
jgi:transcriptional regulator with XRE-family HTH domain